MWMVLAPGEVFQHVHADRSVTVLEQGQVDLEVGDRRERLVAGQLTLIDADTPHRLVNVGSYVALVKCVHVGPGAPPPQFT